MLRLLIALCGILITAPAWSCRPAPIPKPEVTLQEADIVFRGRITKIEYIEPTGKLQEEADQSPVSKDVPRLPQGTLKIYAAPIAVVKGDPSGDVPLLSHALGSIVCDVPFLAGFEYLFVVRPLEGIDQFRDVLDDLPSDTAGYVDQTTQVFLDEPSVSERFDALLRLADKADQQSVGGNR